MDAVLIGGVLGFALLSLLLIAGCGSLEGH
jgi:hypothetical protein